MPNWGYAIGQGLAKGADAIGMLADQQIKQNYDEIIANRNLDMKVRMEAMDMQMKEAAAARERSRLSKYSEGEVTETVGGAATAVDDEGNSNSPNDYKANRKKTLREIQDAMIAGGDTNEAGKIGVQDDRRQDNARAERLATEGIAAKRDIAKTNADARIAVGAGHDEAKIFLGTDKDGNPVVKGTGAASMNAQLASLDRDIRLATEREKNFTKAASDITLDEKQIKELKGKAEEAAADRLKYSQRKDDFIATIGKKTEGAAGGMLTAPPPAADKPALGTKDMPMTLPKNKDGLAPASWYMTSRGLAKWNGTEFEN